MASKRTLKTLDVNERLDVARRAAKRDPIVREVLDSWLRMYESATERDTTPEAFIASTPIPTTRKAALALRARWDAERAELSARLMEIANRLRESAARSDRWVARMMRPGAKLTTTRTRRVEAGA